MITLVGLLRDFFVFRLTDYAGAMRVQNAKSSFPRDLAPRDAMLGDLYRTQKAPPGVEG